MGVVLSIYNGVYIYNFMQNRDLATKSVRLGQQICSNDASKKEVLPHV